jgi:dienelactone hydrolase
MTDVILFHHAQGRTDGVCEFAELLQSHGHRVTVPDLYEGARFDKLDDGVAFADEIGFATIMERGRAAADQLPGALVYAGFSLGVLPAQQLAQTRPGALGAVLMSACIPPTEFAAAWPDGVPAQVHGKVADPFFAGEGDLDVARTLAAEVEGIELYVYPGEEHLFADRSLPSYDEPAAALLTQRVLDFLERSAKP